MAAVDSSATLAQLLRSFRGGFIATAVFSLVSNVLVLTIPLYLLSVFTNVFTSLSVETLFMLTAIAVGALFLQAGVEALRGKVLTRIGAGLDARLGHRVLEASVRQAAGGAVHGSQGMRDVDELRAMLAGPDVCRLVDIPLVPLFVLLLYLVHPVLSAIAAIGAVLLFALALVNELATRRPLDSTNAAAMSGLERVEDYVRNADAIEAMAMMPSVSRRWRASNQDKLENLLVASDRASLISSLARLVRMLLQIAIIGGGTHLFLQQEVLPGAIIAASILMGRALAPLEAAIGTWKVVTSGRAAYRRLAETLRRAGARQADGMALPPPAGHLSLEAVTVAAPGTRQLVLKGVSFALPAGEMLGVIGPSGAGKTTLGKVLVGVLPCNAGAARLDGAELRSWHPDELGRHLGYLPQDVQLFSGTVGENIARLDPDARGEDIVAAARLAGVHDLVLRLPEGYDTQVGDSGRALSAGQRQHIALARAYFGNPRVVVLDEPNSNLDSESEHSLVRAMAAARAAGITQVVITHRPGILGGADKMLMLRAGKCELFGPRQQVMATLNKAWQQAQQGARGAEQASADVASRQR